VLVRISFYHGSLEFASGYLPLEKDIELIVRSALISESASAPSWPSRHAYLHFRKTEVGPYGATETKWRPEESRLSRPIPSGWILWQGIKDGHEVHVSAYQLVRRHNTETDGEDVVRDPTETDGLVSESRRADFSHDAVRQGADGQVKGEDPGEHHTYEFQHSQKTMECGGVEADQLGPIVHLRGPDPR
jgi:hypothetical protein